MNEHITGREWPPKAVRNERLGECVSVIRRLLAGERVTHDGLVSVASAAEHQFLVSSVLTGSALFVYGLAWGVRSGLLEEPLFGPAIIEASPPNFSLNSHLRGGA